MQNDKSLGGLRLVDRKVKDESLKIQWVQEAQCDPVIAALAYQILDVKIKDLIWSINLNVQDVDKICRRDSFWKDVLEAWAKYHFTVPQNIEQIVQQCIWGNSLWPMGNLPFLNYVAIQKDLIYIGQLFTEDYRWKTFQQIDQSNPGALTILQYNALIVSFPTSLEIVALQSKSMERKQRIYMKRYVTPNTQLEITTAI